MRAQGIAHFGHHYEDDNDAPVLDHYRHGINDYHNNDGNYDYDDYSQRHCDL